MVLFCHMISQDYLNKRLLDLNYGLEPNQACHYLVMFGILGSVVVDM